MTKAIVSLSGGLDSILATRLILDQGIKVEAVHFTTVFYKGATPGERCRAASSAAGQLGIKLNVFEVSNELFKILKNPKHGYGSNINPCIDCHMFMFKKAADYMRKAGASFIITGEVLGERPMSQRKDAMRIIDRDTGLGGLILRPLSAKLLESTIPEKEGLVDRERLLDIRGRSRKPQIRLAEQFGIKNYPNAAGGCLLTDPGFANRMRDLIKYKPDFTINDVQLLKIGRHFRLAPEVKIVVGRNEKENDMLLNLAKDGDLHFYPTKVKGPVGVGRGVFNKDYIFTATSVIARYSDKDSSDQQLEIAYKRIPANAIDSTLITPASESELDTLRV